MSLHGPCLLGNPTLKTRARTESPADLIKGDLFTVPVFNIEEHNHSAILVPAGEDPRVTRLDSAADGLHGEAIEQLRVLEPEVHIAWKRKSQAAISAAFPATLTRLLRWHMVRISGLAAVCP